VVAGLVAIEGQDVINLILTQLRQKEQRTPVWPLLVPPTRAPPGTLPFLLKRIPAQPKSIIN